MLVCGLLFVSGRPWPFPQLGDVQPEVVVMILSPGNEQTSQRKTENIKIKPYNIQGRIITATH